MGQGENPNVHHHMFIHNVLANFYKDTLDYFSDYLYPRFEWTVMGTYQKSIEYINKTAQNSGRETDKPNLPALILNPSGEFQIGDGNMGAKQLWRYPNLAPGFVKRIFDPVYQDQHMIINVGFSRFVGDIELIILPSSFYEYCDIKVYFQQIFGGPPGTERPIYPNFFNSFIIIPDELVNYTYNNEYTGANYQIDWYGAGATQTLVKTTNQNELTIPCKIKPLFRLASMGDGSTKYGGTDNLAEWRLTATINFEIELPTFMLIDSDYLVENINFNFGYSSAYTTYPDYANQIPVNLEKIETNWDSTIDETSNTTTEIIPPVEVESITKRSHVLNNRYHHIITSGDVAAVDFIIVTLPVVVNDHKLIKVMGKYGLLDYGDHYTLINGGTELSIVQNVKFLEGDILELFIYDEKWIKIEP